MRPTRCALFPRSAVNPFFRPTRILFYLPGKVFERGERDPLSPSPHSSPHSLYTTGDFSGCGMSPSGLRNGIVVAVSLNPAASTSFVDPGLNKLASEIVVRKYVAILSGIVRLSSFSTLSFRNLPRSH